MFPVGQADELETPKCWPVWSEFVCVCEMRCVWCVCNVCKCISICVSDILVLGCAWMECWGESLSLWETGSTVGGIMGMWSHVLTYTPNILIANHCVCAFLFRGIMSMWGRAARRGSGSDQVKLQPCQDDSGSSLLYFNALFEPSAHR